jgi:hypothetical protein
MDTHHDWGSPGLRTSEDGGFGLVERVEIFIPNHAAQKGPKPEAEGAPKRSDA